jgi:hypothetical protein
MKWAANRFVPVESWGWEWLIMRIGTLAVVLHILSEPHPFALEGQPMPVGLAKVLDLSFLHHPQAHTAVWIVAGLFGLAYVIGWQLKWSALGLGAVLCLVRTYFNSQGYTHHGTQLVTLVLLVQSGVAWWVSWEGKKGRALCLASQAIYYSQGMVAVSYVASALTKFINSKGLWLWRSKYICVELIKTHRLDYYNRLDPALAGDPPLATWLLQHPMVGQILFGAGFVLEAAALLALHSRRWALMLGVSIIAMHESIDWIMRLHFTNHEWLALLYLVNPIFWLWWAIRGRRLEDYSQRLGV